MNCKFIRKNTAAYLEHNLSRDEKERFEKHLSSCKECSKMFSEFKQTWAFLKSESEVQPNPFFYTRLEQKIQNEEVARSGKLLPVFLGVLKTIAAGLLILLSIVSGILIGTQFTDQAAAGNGYESEYDYYTESVYFGGIDNEPIESYLLNENEK